MIEYLLECGASINYCYHQFNKKPIVRFLQDDIDILTGEVSKDNTAHLIRLAGYRRAIANFVNLVTGKDIPDLLSESDVYYVKSDSTESFTKNLRDFHNQDELNSLMKEL